MINNNSVDAVYTLVDRLEGRGQVARPMPGTPLDALVRAGIDPVVSYVDVNSPDSPYSIIEESKCVDAAGIAQHQVTLDTLADTIAATVEANMNTARNVVNPLVQQMVDTFERRVGTARANAENVVAIVPDFYQKIWANPVITGMVEIYAEAPMRQKKLSVSFPNLDAGQLVELMKTGSSRFDDELTEFVEQIGAEAVIDVYASLFSLTKQYPNLEASDLLSPYHQNRDFLLVAHLLARKLLQSPPEGLEISLVEYREYVAFLVEQSGRAVCRVLEKRDSDVKNRTLVTSYPVERLAQAVDQVEIRVNGEVYNTWLKEGGTPETLFGAYVSDQARSYTRLLAEREQYESVWKREVQIIQTRVRFEMINIKMDALRAAIQDVINESDEAQVPGSRTEMHAHAKAELAKVTAPMLDNIYVLARRLVCRSMFDRTDAEKILVAIDEAAKANPDMDIQEAVLIGAAEYVSLWIASQIQIDRA